MLTEIHSYGLIEYTIWTKILVQGLLGEKKKNTKRFAVWFFNLLKMELINFLTDFTFKPVLVS